MDANSSLVLSTLAARSSLFCGFKSIFAVLAVLGLSPVGVVTLPLLLGLSSFGCLPDLPISVGLGNSLVYFSSLESNSIADSIV